MKNKICTAADKDGNLKRGEYTGYSETTKKHHVSFYDGKTNAFTDITAITFEDSSVFETGATSAAVNELILFTDNTHYLVDLRDRIYDSYKYDDRPDIWDMEPLLYAAQREYKAQMETQDFDVSHIRFMSEAMRNEYCQIYANRFEEWKKEKERNSK